MTYELDENDQSYCYECNPDSAFFLQLSGDGQFKQYMPICKLVSKLKFTEDIQTRDLVPYCKKYETKNNYRTYPLCSECNPFYEFVHKRGEDDSEIDKIRDVFQCKVKHCKTGKDLPVYPEDNRTDQQKTEIDFFGSFVAPVKWGKCSDCNDRFKLTKGGFRCVHEDNFTHCKEENISELEERGVTHCTECKDDTYPEDNKIYYNSSSLYKLGMRLVQLQKDTINANEVDLTKKYINSSTGIIGKYYNKCDVVNSNQGTDVNYETPDNLQFCLKFNQEFLTINTTYFQCLECLNYFEPSKNHGKQCVIKNCKEPKDSNGNARQACQNDNEVQKISDTEVLSDT